MKKTAKVNITDQIEINHYDWCEILEGLKLREQKIRQDSFYSSRNDDTSRYHSKLIELLMKVHKIVNFTEHPSIKHAREFFKKK